MYAPNLPISRPPFNKHLEALRAVAAVVVVWGHVIFHRYELDPNYRPVGIFSYIAPGHFAVILFFVLSGYVIGLTHAHRMRGHEILSYLHKRFIRIYPIYLVSLIAGLAVAGFTYSWTTVGWHLVFGINGFPAITIFENNPLWSLQYEVLFYLLFIPLSILNARPWWVAIISGLLSLVFLMTYPTGLGKFLSPYLIGFSIWSVGWALASLALIAKPVSYVTLVSTILLFLAVEPFNVLTTIGQKVLLMVAQHPVGPFSLQGWNPSIISPIDFMALPYAVLIVLRFMHVRGRWWNVGYVLLQLLPFYTFKYLLAHRTEPAMQAIVIPVVCYLTSTLLFFWPTQKQLEQFCQQIIQALIPIGAISYGLYLIHFPVMAAFHRVGTFSGTVGLFEFRVVLLFAITFALAYLLEKFWQPFVVRQLKKWGMFPKLRTVSRDVTN